MSKIYLNRVNISNDTTIVITRSKFRSNNIFGYTLGITNWYINVHNRCVYLSHALFELKSVKRCIATHISYSCIVFMLKRNYVCGLRLEEEVVWIVIRMDIAGSGLQREILAH